MSVDSVADVSSGSEWLTRAEAAKRLGFRSVGGVRALERAGALIGQLDVAGVHRFSAEEIERIASERRAGRRVLPTVIARTAAPAQAPSAPLRRQASVEGAVASDAFALLDEGSAPVDLVRALSITPNAAEQLSRDHARLRGLPGGGTAQEHASRVASEIAALKGAARGLREEFTIAYGQHEDAIRGLIGANLAMERRLAESNAALDQLRARVEHLSEELQLATFIAARALNEARGTGG